MVLHLASPLFSVGVAAVAAWRSFKTIKNGEVDFDLLIVWIVLAAYEVLELSLEFLVSWIPFYYAAKLVFKIGLAYPGTQLPQMLEVHALQPFVKTADETIDRVIMPVLTFIVIDVPRVLLDLAFPTDEPQPLSSPGRGRCNSGWSHLSVETSFSAVEFDTKAKWKALSPEQQEEAASTTATTQLRKRYVHGSSSSSSAVGLDRPTVASPKRVSEAKAASEKWSSPAKAVSAAKTAQSPSPPPPEGKTAWGSPTVAAEGSGRSSRPLRSTEMKGPGRAQQQKGEGEDSDVGGDDKHEEKAAEKSERWAVPVRGVEPSAMDVGGEEEDADGASEMEVDEQEDDDDDDVEDEEEDKRASWSSNDLDRQLVERHLRLIAGRNGPGAVTGGAARKAVGDSTAAPSLDMSGSGGSSSLDAQARRTARALHGQPAPVGAPPSLGGSRDPAGPVMPLEPYRRGNPVLSSRTEALLRERRRRLGGEGYADRSQSPSLYSPAATDSTSSVGSRGTLDGPQALVMRAQRRYDLRGRAPQRPPPTRGEDTTASAPTAPPPSGGSKGRDPSPKWQS